METVSWLSAAQADVPREDDWLADALAGRLRAVRRTESRRQMRLGYWVAASAIARVLGMDPADHGTLRLIVLWDAPDGSPEAFVDGEPAGVSIAWVRRAGWAVCALTAPHIRLGCDLRPIEPADAALVTSALSDAEQHLVTNAGDDAELVTHLLASAKESTRNTLRSRGTADLRAFEVRLASDVRAAWGRLTVHRAASVTCHGWWRRFDRLILTVTADAPVLPPRSLVVPPALPTGPGLDAWPAGSPL